MSVALELYIFAIGAVLMGMAVMRMVNNEQQENIMAKLKELAGKLGVIGDTLDKVKTEVQALKDSLTDVELPPEAEAALDRLAKAADALDALNPDPEPPAGQG